MNMSNVERIEIVKGAASSLYGSNAVGGVDALLIETIFDSLNAKAAIYAAETTMNPENRTILQVSLEDSIEADKIFTVLMGDKVEPRRKFIEDNAKYVRNLDL